MTFLRIWSRVPRHGDGQVGAEESPHPGGHLRGASGETTVLASTPNTQCFTAVW